MKACHEHLPKVTNVACFDSAFHHSLPERVRSYAIDPKIAKEKGLRKYGFHGLSYSYASISLSHQPCPGLLTFIDPPSNCHLSK